MVCPTTTRACGQTPFPGDEGIGLSLNTTLGLYGLSDTLYVEPPDAPYATVAAITSTPANGTDYRAGETITATVTFSEAVEVDTTSGTPSLGLGIGSNTRDADYQSIDSTGMVLTFTYPVVGGDEDLDGIAVAMGALKLNGGAVTGTTGDHNGVAAVLTHAAITADENQKVDGDLDAIAPSVDSATVSTDGVIIDIVFDEDLDRSGSEPAALAFQVTVGTASAVNPSSVDFHATAATTVALTMGTAIAAGETVSVAYTKPSANALADAASNEVESFTGTDAIAAPNRPAAPVVTLSAGDGKLTATWAAPANGGSTITDYDVQWRTASQTWDEAETAGQSDTAAATTTTHEITGLTNNTEHTVRVRAGNDAGDGPWSAEASETPVASITQVTAEFGAASYTALEGRGAVTITVNLSADPERSVNVPITVTENGGAGNGDYTRSATSVTINSGDTSATFTVTATDDLVYDGEDNDETLALGFGTLPDGVSPGTQDTTDVSLIDNEVLVSSDLVPGDFKVGDEFRLLFVTSNRRNAQPSDIAKYNKFVQDAAASGHTGIQDYSSLFRALGSTTSIDARDNTATNRNKDGQGEEIWWLNGPKAADDYADFYNGSWDHRDPGRDQNGAVHDFPAGTAGTVWTGSQSNGQGDSGNELGASTVTAAKPSSGSGHEINGATVASRNSSKPLYGLSRPVLRAAGCGAGRCALCDRRRGGSRAFQRRVLRQRQRQRHDHGQGDVQRGCAGDRHADVPAGDRLEHPRRGVSGRPEHRHRAGVHLHRRRCRRRQR